MRYIFVLQMQTGYSTKKMKATLNHTTQLSSYLTFNGNCREAMTFYATCLGGQLKFQTIGESPLSEKMPAQMREYILHASLTKGNMVIMATDCVREEGLIKGNAVSLCLNCSSEEEIKVVFKKLAAGGKANHPLEDTFWGALFGDVTDKYGNNWLLNYNRQ
ncbi:MAG: VOC family protein [Ferruginibacter sp.]|nr:VOC family protein [Ferruginibacter sp.]